MTATAFDLAAAKAEHWPRLSWRDVFNVTGEDADAIDDAALFDYFARFLPIQHHETSKTCIACAGCGERLSGGLMGFLMGATFEWGIAHGEGFCRECGYPGRAIHYDVGPIKRIEIVLQYHPDELKRRGESAEAAPVPAPQRQESQ